uniref:Uncharacterized protein n=1 Tax=Amphimedon queenslandica TaxID=400682 RepID=A0A1X7VCQ8_AMPQE
MMRIFVSADLATDAQVLPSMSVSLGSAPSLINESTTALLSVLAAKCNGVA